MNIFYLHENPMLCAQMHCDSHVVKMILETAQILSTAIRLRGQEFGYKITHRGHPCVQWVLRSKENFLWLRQLGIALCEEYTYRYGKQHKSFDIIKESIRFASYFLKRPITKRPQCMPSIYHDNDCQTAYHNYYLGEKTYLLKYTKRNVPDWIESVGLGVHK